MKKFECIGCQWKTELPEQFDFEYFYCPECSSSYQNNRWLVNRNKNASFNNFYIKIGKRVSYFDKEYIVSGVLSKRNNHAYEWVEFVLSPLDVNEENVYLSEFDGHWIILQESTFAEEVLSYTKNKLDPHNLKRYRRASSTVVRINAIGFYDYNPLEKLSLKEYVEVPYIYSVETYSDDSIQPFVGQHISQKEVKQIFSTDLLPYRTGIGMVQPFLINIRNMAIVFLTAAFLMLAMNVYTYRNSQDHKIYDEQLEFSNGKTFLTNPFTLTGPMGNLDCHFYAPVQNSWANCVITLVNDKTNDKIYLSKDIESYSGYEDGESWSEGATTTTSNICGIAAGTYHLEFEISREDVPIIDSSATMISSNFMTSSKEYPDRIQVNILWKKPSLWNVNMTVLFLLGILIISIIANEAFEEKRTEQNF